MDEAEFITFQKYTDKAAALELGNLLKENAIPYIIEESPARFSPTFVVNELDKEFAVKIQKYKFLIAENLQQEIILKQLDDVDADYYLLHFTDEELIDIVAKRYEWSPFDFLLAQKILKNRGKEMNPETVELLKKKELETLSKPETSAKTRIIGGYVSAVLGGFVGLFIGWHLFTHKKILPNGDVVKAFSESDRKHGLAIFFIGLVSLVIIIIVRIKAVFLK